MIATLSGTVSEKINDIVVLEAGGVGYGLSVTAEDYGILEPGQDAKVYVHEHIREAAHDLYGFVKLDTLRLFGQLLAVNGVGPKMAINVLSIGNTGDVRRAIASGDIKQIQRAPGVGKRVAERIVVDLKDKVGLAGVDLAAAGMLQSDAFISQDEAVQALTALGYSPQDAAAALAKVPADLPLEERIKQALKH